MRKAAAFLSALIFSMAFAPQVSGQKEGWPDLLPIQLNGKWGFIDRSALVSLCRSALNHPPTPVGGISTVEAKPLFV